MLVLPKGYNTAVARERAADRELRKRYLEIVVDDVSTIRADALPMNLHIRGGIEDELVFFYGPKPSVQTPELPIRPAWP